MTEFAGYDTIFLAVFLLLLLGILTIEACRRDHVASSDSPETFLFRGRLPIHSLASNVGATFSVTYFFGAIVIYAQLFHSWFVVTLAVAFPLIYLLFARALRIAEQQLSSESLSKQRGNILLDLLRRAYPVGFETITAVYLVIYFGLLIEELAVSRLIFASIIPGRPLIVSFIMWVICLVVVAYLWYGGFRGSLIADLVQVGILSSFFVMLAFLIVKHGTMGTLLDFPIDRPAIRLSNLVLVGALALAWFLTGVDYFSRFNFDAEGKEELSKRRRLLAKATALFVFITLALGVLFSQSLSTEIPARITPSKYVSALASFFLVKSAPVYRIIFLVSVHCMVFTTINTLLVTLLQVSYYKAGNPMRRDRLLLIVLAAALISSRIDKDLVHIVGIFVGSLLMLLVIPVAGVLFPKATSWFPPRNRYLWWALAGSVIAFVALEPRLISRFEYHFLLPAIPLTLALFGMVVEKSVFRSLKGGEQ